MNRLLYLVKSSVYKFENLRVGWAGLPSDLASVWMAAGCLVSVRGQCLLWKTGSLAALSALHLQQRGSG